MASLEGCITNTVEEGWITEEEECALALELVWLRRHAAAWKRLCEIDRAWPKTHLRPMLPRGIMAEVNALALGDEP